MTFYNRRLICRRSTLTHVSMNNGGENEDLACHSDGEAGSSGTLFKERSNLLDTVSKLVIWDPRKVYILKKGDILKLSHQIPHLFSLAQNIGLQ
uniref:Uncharacterized protein n=1 Tax=Romanomermis culicivorax TaxID=13658 RepID=A0A915I2S5_ROMCU